MSHAPARSRFRSPFLIASAALLLLAVAVTGSRLGGAQASVAVPQGVTLKCDNPLNPVRGNLALDPASGDRRV